MAAPIVIPDFVTSFFKTAFPGNKTCPHPVTVMIGKNKDIPVTHFQVGPETDSVKMEKDKFGNWNITVLHVINAKAIRKAFHHLYEYFKAKSLSDGLWVNFKQPHPANIAGVLPDGFQVGAPLGNSIADTQQGYTRYWVWLNPAKECNMPPAATHQLAGNALLISEDGKVLFCRRKQNPSRWATPGGMADPKESTEGTAVREVGEELGVELKTKDAAQVGKLQFPGNPFARAESGLYAFMVPKATQVVPNEEFVEIKWFPLADVLDCPKNEKGDRKLAGYEISPEFITPLESAVDGLAMVQTDQKGNFLVVSAVKKVAQFTGLKEIVEQQRKEKAASKSAQLEPSSLEAKAV